MLLLEVNKPGAKMGLALGLLRAMVASQTMAGRDDFAEWLKTVCRLGLRMIEETLAEPCDCDPNKRAGKLHI